MHNISTCTFFSVSSSKHLCLMSQICLRDQRCFGAEYRCYCRRKKSEGPSCWWEFVTLCFMISLVSPMLFLSNKLQSINMLSIIRLYIYIHKSIFVDFSSCVGEHFKAQIIIGVKQIRVVIVL